MNYIRFPFELIEIAQQYGWYLSLCYLVRLKSYKRKGIFYNYTYKDLAIVCKCHRQTITKHIKILIAKGLIKTHNGNLIIIGTYKMQQMCVSKRLVQIQPKFKKEKIYLHYEIVKNNIKKQSCIVKSISELTNLQKKVDTRPNLTPDELKTFITLRSRFEQKRMVRNYTTLSVLRFGTLFNRSHVTGRKYRNQMANEKLIEVHKKYEHCGRVSLKNFCFYKRKGSIEKYAIWKNGIILTPISSEINILSDISIPKKKTKITSKDLSKMNYDEFLFMRKEQGW